MTETEVKIFEIKPADVRQRLKRAKARLVKKVFQKNQTFKGNGFDNKKSTLRIRDEGKQAFLTLKGPAKVVNQLRVRDEFELGIDDPAMMKKILLRLGFRESRYVEIKREYYSLCNTSVEIIIVPTLPPYIEIEGEPKAIDLAAKKLGFSKKDFYPGALAEKYPSITKKNIFKFR